MRSPNLNDLPPSPSGKAGWPWTEDSPQLPDSMPDGSPWPRVSIVTPSYNQDQFIEETIRSVLLQGYPNLEYIVIDGGSQDQTVDILRKYDPWLTYWISEEDKGQSDALNKGIAQTTGEILGWLNSDDLYCVGAIGQAVATFQADIDVVYGSSYTINEASRIVASHWAMAFDPRYPLYSGLGIRQQTLFWRKKLMSTVGMVDIDLVFCMDRDLITRLIWHGTVERTIAYLGMFRSHDQSKTANLQEINRQERLKVQLRYRHYHQTHLPSWFWRFYVDIRRWGIMAYEAGPRYVFTKIRRRIQRWSGKNDDTLIVLGK